MTVTFCHSILVPSYLHEFDDANDKVGAERRPSENRSHQLRRSPGRPPERKIDDVKKMTTVSTVTAGSTTHGVAVGPRQFIADQLLAKVDVIRAMHERVQLCQHHEKDVALLREGLGVGRINHILRVHGHDILQEKRAAEIYDEVGQRSLERLFPRFTDDRSEQATLSAGQSVIGYKRARDTAGPAHFGALIAAKPRILAMIQDAEPAFCRNNPWKLASPRLLKQPPPPTIRQ